MAKPQPAVLSAMVSAVRHHGLDTRLGFRLFAPENWHQSLSSRYFVEAGLRDKLLRAGDRVSAVMCPVTLNRINSGWETPGRRDWAFRTRGDPKELKALRLAIQAALLAEGLDAPSTPTPHVTISYLAPSPLPSQQIEPIDWTIDEILLVEGGGAPYHYRTIATGPLAAPPYPYAQLRLL
ncbi:2'-5' RNA ligase family protein [Neisseriaceae bacterium JH1-16]|nr:2'-5' RNA ligase family protein [Neisseriaceae bacterium JH1-16]